MTRDDVERAYEESGSECPAPEWTGDPMLAQVENWFTHHPPEPGDVARYERIRAEARAFARTLVELCPPSADRSAAVRLVREAVMTANASIACKGR